jgi:hypothetical protein
MLLQLLLVCDHQRTGGAGYFSWHNFSLFGLFFLTGSAAAITRQRSIVTTTDNSDTGCDVISGMDASHVIVRVGSGGKVRATQLAPRSI